jgi:hypothetical protein
VPVSQEEYEEREKYQILTVHFISIIPGGGHANH